MTSESRSENGATVTSSYIYDALGQLVNFTRSDGQSESYAYDAVGNMLTKTQNGVSTAMRYNAANQLVQSVSGGETTAYSYDANGNLVKSENAAGARSYAYNALNLLEKFTREDGYSESYGYNAQRLLSSVTTSEDVTTTLTWDILYGDGVVIGAAQNGENTRFVYGLERISAVTGNTRTEYLHDGRGSVAAELIYNGTSLTETITKTYSPFGEQLSEAVSGFGYNGEYYNAATGMIYLRARFYAPEMNRFSQKDLLRGSIFDGGSLNRYLYCQNDPVDFADYNGRQMCAACCLMDGNGSGGGGGGKIQKTEETIRSISAAVSNAASSVASVCSEIKQKVGESIVEFCGSDGEQFETYADCFQINKLPSLGLPYVKEIVRTTYSCISGITGSLWNELRYRGEIHRAVQEYLSAKYGLNVEKSIDDGKHRFDLYRAREGNVRGEYWEVKPISYINVGTQRHDDLLDRLKAYDLLADRGEPLGVGGFPYKDYWVDYYSTTRGIVYYKFKKSEKDETKEVIPAQKKKDNQNENHKSNITAFPQGGNQGVAAIADTGAAVLMVLAFYMGETVGGGGGGKARLMNQYD